MCSRAQLLGSSASPGDHYRKTAVAYRPKGDISHTARTLLVKELTPTSEDTLERARKTFEGDDEAEVALVAAWRLRQADGYPPKRVCR